MKGLDRYINDTSLAFDFDKKKKVLENYFCEKRAK